MHGLVDDNKDTKFVRQIHLIESFKSAAFLSAVSLMCEIGDFSAFQSPKQLFAYFGTMSRKSTTENEKFI